LLRGDLKRLPSEIMREIMLNLDIQSLNTWRRVSSFFLYFVDNLREYSLFKENAWHTLSVMHFCDLGSMFPIRRHLLSSVAPIVLDVARLVRSFFYLRSRAAVANVLLLQTARFGPWNILSLRALGGTSRAMSDQWLRVGSRPPPAYGSIAGQLSEYDPLVSLRQAMELAISVHGSEQKAKAVYERCCKELSAWLEKFIPPQDANFPPPSTSPCRSDEKQLFLSGRRAATDLPYWDPKANTLESGTAAVVVLDVQDRRPSFRPVLYPRLRHPVF
jgi:hypothetical protein